MPRDVKVIKAERQVEMRQPCRVLALDAEGAGASPVLPPARPALHPAAVAGDSMHTRVNALALCCAHGSNLVQISFARLIS